MANYTVRRGDSLAAIATRFGMSLADVEKANPQIARPNSIQTGSKVHLPDAFLPSRAETRVHGGQRGPVQLEGSDTSSWQTDSVFQSSLQGKAWTAIRATEGSTSVDRTFAARWKELGKRVASGQMQMRCAYAFLHAGNGTAQANHFLNTVNIHGALPKGTCLALDWEAGALKDPKALKDAATRIHQVTGIWPVVYAQGSQVNRAHAAVPKAPLWEAKWSGKVPTNVPFVQNSDHPGYDHDLFNGDSAALRQFADGNRRVFV